ncbi:hypothetical protein BN140_3071 [Methanoculleus bourgensis MS2]|uniref:Uncharacterized protein n=2 Tax=Methanoculleus bourgensis TaxID=83986 RepID=W6PQL0_METBM|nr:hypothetical protein BN140_3071 [Methanoculleus bourgensis MS2]CVK34504.1 protein of unknown function [Methanoculleus bourgensis]
MVRRPSIRAGQPLQTASMEPCLFRHGKGRFAWAKVRCAAELQWSHVFSDMVRRMRSSLIVASPQVASMEPCLFRHGKCRVGRDDAVHGPASMEPCLFRHGKVPVVDNGHAPGGAASMEPCLFRHGKGCRFG